MAGFNTLFTSQLLLVFVLLLFFFSSHADASCAQCCSFLGDKTACTKAYQGQQGICCGYLYNFQQHMDLPYCCPNTHECQYNKDRTSFQCAPIPKTRRPGDDARGNPIPTRDSTTTTTPTNTNNNHNTKVKPNDGGGFSFTGLIIGVLFGICALVMLCALLGWCVGAIRRCIANCCMGIFGGLLPRPRPPNGPDDDENNRSRPNTPGRGGTRVTPTITTASRGGRTLSQRERIEEENKNNDTRIDIDTNAAKTSGKLYGMIPNEAVTTATTTAAAASTTNNNNNRYTHNNQYDDYKTTQDTSAYEYKGDFTGGAVQNPYSMEYPTKMQQQQKQDTSQQNLFSNRQSNPYQQQDSIYQYPFIGPQATANAALSASTTQQQNQQQNQNQSQNINLPRENSLSTLAPYRYNPEDIYNLPTLPPSYESLGGVDYLTNQQKDNNQNNQQQTSPLQLQAQTDLFPPEVEREILLADGTQQQQHPHNTSITPAITIVPPQQNNQHGQHNQQQQPPQHINNPYIDPPAHRPSTPTLPDQPPAAFVEQTDPYQSDLGHLPTTDTPAPLPTYSSMSLLMRGNASAPELQDIPEVSEPQTPTDVTQKGNKNNNSKNNNNKNNKNNKKK